MEFTIILSIVRMPARERERESLVVEIEFEVGWENLHQGYNGL